MTCTCMQIRKCVVHNNLTISVVMHRAEKHFSLFDPKSYIYKKRINVELIKDTKKQDRTNQLTQTGNDT